MRTDIPVRSLVATIVTAVLALGLFLYLNNSFGGPHVPPRHPYELTATFADSQNIVRKSLVMYRGVKVGEVTNVEIERGKAKVSFTVFDSHRPVRAGAAAQIGHRTIFGEAIVVLHPGARAGRELRSGTRLPALDTVEPDEALQVFEPRTRRNLARGARELARGLRSPRASQRVSDTYAGLWSAVTRLRGITDALRGERDEIERLVRGGSVAVGVLGRKEDALRRIVGSGREVLDTVAAQRDALGTGIDELDRLLVRARAVLPRAKPLLAEGERLAREGIGTARVLSPALVELKPLTRESRIVFQSLRPANRLAVPVLRSALGMLRELGPVGKALGPMLANTVPMVGWLAERREEFAAFIANGADSVDNGDSDGKWMHGFLVLEPRGGLIPPGPCSAADGLCSNAYPQPGDAAKPQVYQPGSFPRLRPYKP